MVGWMRVCVCVGGSGLMAGPRLGRGLGLRGFGSRGLDLAGPGAGASPPVSPNSCSPRRGLSDMKQAHPVLLASQTLGQQAGAPRPRVLSSASS